MELNEFFKKYFLVNLSDYPNIGIDLEINLIMLWFLIGVIVASLVVNYRRAGMHLVVKSLMRHEAKDEESAKTLAEMKISSLSAKIALMGGGRLSRVVKRVGQKEYSYEEYVALSKKKGFKEEKINFETARFYIADPNSDDARHIFERGGASLVNTILFCVLLIAIYICLMFLMPGILDLINNMLEK